MAYPIPDEALDDRLAVVGTAGSGKTYAAGTAIERVLDGGARAVIIDPLGVWYGLRLAADGKREGFPVVIFGGPHGDLALNEHAGSVIGEACARMAESAIVDLSEIGTAAGERRFALAFLTALYRKTTGEPLHLILDEADMWAPQVIRDKDGEAAKLFAITERIVRRGRIKGFIPWLITQRPSVIAKDVLSQADGVIAMKLTGKHDRDALGSWVEGSADLDELKALKRELPTFETGEGVIWVPGRNIMARAKFPAKRTFDSSRTPKRGEKKRTAELKPLDVAGLKSRLEAVEQEAKANDPAVLKAEIAKLKKELAVAAKSAGKPATPDPSEISKAGAQGYQQGVAAANRIFAPIQAAVGAAAAAIRVVEERAAEFESFAGAPPPPLTQSRPSRPITAPPARDYRTPARSPKDVVPHNNSPSAANGALAPGERAVLIAAVQFDGVGKDQLSVLTGYKTSSRNAYIARLKAQGLVSVDGQTVRPEPGAVAALGADYEPLPTGVDLQNYWAGKLPEGEWRVLEHLIAAYPSGVPRAEIDVATGYKVSSRNAYIARLKARRLVTVDGQSVTAAENLF